MRGAAAWKAPMLLWGGVGECGGVRGLGGVGAEAGGWIGGGDGAGDAVEGGGVVVGVEGGGCGVVPGVDLGKNEGGEGVLDEQPEHNGVGHAVVAQGEGDE